MAMTGLDAPAGSAARVALRPDVAIVGSGIAGAALATLLARAGREVVLLERERRFRDRVRGEFLAPWGVAEAIRVGLYDALRSTPGSDVLTGYVPYDEIYDRAEAEERRVDFARAVPGVPGALALGHPDACEALTRAAVAAGATVVRGVARVGVAPGRAPTVHFVHEDGGATLRPRLAVGADGRGSRVRTAVGMSLHQTEARTFGVGLLVEGLSRWPAGMGAIGTEGARHYAVFPRADGRARLYLFCALEARGRLGGPGARRRFLEDFAFACLPGSDEIVHAQPSGPCAGFPMNDTWTDRPVAPGVALVGDAAGASDPVIGQGLSVAIRDAAVLAAVLAGSSAWTPRALGDYGHERQERMRRLRITARLVGTLRCSFGAASRVRRRVVADLLRAEPERRLVALAAVVGPQRVPAEAFDEAAVERLLVGVGQPGAIS